MDKDADLETVLEHVCDQLQDADLKKLVLKKAKKSEKEKVELREQLS